MTALPVRPYAKAIQLSFGDLLVYEGSNEYVLLTKNLQALLPWVHRMARDTMGTVGELRVRFVDGRVVDEGPGKRPKTTIE